jgi:hypothetical protein
LFDQIIVDYLFEDGGFLMGRKVAFVLIDGIGDVSIPALGGKTPLEAAQTPFMDAIAGTSLPLPCLP